MIQLQTIYVVSGFVMKRAKGIGLKYFITFFADWSLSLYLTSTKALQEASKAIMKIDKVLVIQKSPP